MHPGQRIGIHAAKETRGLVHCKEWPFSYRVPDAMTLPLGAIIGTATLDRASEMTEESIARLAAERPAEYAFGLYQPGRWAWVLRDPVPLPSSVPYKGSQGSFSVPLKLLGLTIEDAPHAAAVRVDDAFVEGDWGKWTGGGHMQADTPEALHAMAARLGLKRAWFQSKPRRPEHDHYDLTASKREHAIRLGALPITREEAAQRNIAAMRERRQREVPNAA